jgi:hypothetical protein
MLLNNYLNHLHSPQTLKGEEEKGRRNRDPPLPLSPKKAKKKDQKGNTWLRTVQ